MKAHANSQILEEASTWFVELSEGHLTDKVREQFSDWLRASPEHVRAYLQISALWEDAPLLGKGAEDVEALIARTRAAGNVVRVGKDRQPLSVRSRRFVTPLRSALAASLVLAAIGVTFWLQQQRGVYETAIGEQSSLTLADGSTIELNAQSRVRVHFTAAERSVDLLEGQVLFHVTHDTARPFIVHSGAASVRAVGTQFDVDRRSGETVVTVVEGRVAVLPDLLLEPASANAVDSAISAPDFALTGPGGARGLLLTAGEQVTLTAQASSRPTRTDVAAAIAWTQRKLVFASSPLTLVADEYNRYHQKRIVIRDRRLASFFVSGVFSATDSRAFVAFLRAQPNLTVHETDTEIEISGAPPK
ncbi:MAG: FecR family protein [Acetobacteraceae bacterium]